MFTRSELAELLADEDLSDAAIAAMINPQVELDALEADVGSGPDAEARREMLAELRAMMDGGDA